VICDEYKVIDGIHGSLGTAILWNRTDIVAWRSQAGARLEERGSRVGVLSSMLVRGSSFSPALAYLPLTAMRFTFDCACGALGSVTVSTPFLNDADTLFSSTSSTGMRRSKRP
jgi:hypothetical protein